MKFKKKPVTVEANQWFKNGDHPLDDVMRPFEDTGKIPTEPREGKVVRYYRHPSIDGQSTCKHCGKIMHDHGWIDTLEGGHIVCPGDWIITGVAGEFYPCKNNIFEQTYEKVEEVVCEWCHRTINLPRAGQTICNECENKHYDAVKDYYGC